MEESSGISPAEWHTRYQEQAGWTNTIRQYCYERASLAGARCVLEVGCGSGVICADLHAHTSARVYGIDIDRTILHLAVEYDPRTSYGQSDAYYLPFPASTFDVVMCHFFLLWLHQPEKVLHEMKRVTRRGGILIALAEPDYGGRIDHPDDLVELGKLQTESLRKQGADPVCGRKIPGLFNTIGLTNIQYGILGGQWNPGDAGRSTRSESTILEHDLSGMVSDRKRQEWLNLEEKANAAGTRVLFIPTFYAIGRVP